MVIIIYKISKQIGIGTIVVPISIDICRVSSVCKNCRVVRHIHKASMLGDCDQECNSKGKLSFLYYLYSCNSSSNFQVKLGGAICSMTLCAHNRQSQMQKKNCFTGQIAASGGHVQNKEIHTIEQTSSSNGNECPPIIFFGFNRGRSASINALPPLLQNHTSKIRRPAHLRIQFC